MKGRVVDAKAEMESGRKVVKGDDPERFGLWARKDSRPEEKAKAPRGRAESVSRSRWCVDGGRKGAVCVLVDQLICRTVR